MTTNEQINLAQNTLADFHQAEKRAGGIEQIIGKLVRITKGEAGVVLTPMEAAACSQAIGVCVYLSNGIVAHRLASPPAAAPQPTMLGVKTGHLADGFAVPN